MRTMLPLGRVTGVDRDEIDLGDRDALMKLLDATQPSTIVNAAAYTAVDKAEADAATAHRVNGECAGWMAQVVARQRDALLVHYSTDYVFDGSGTARWREDGAPGRCRSDGASKLEGEQAVAASGCRNLVFAHELGLLRARRQLRAHDAQAGRRARGVVGGRLISMACRPVPRCWPTSTAIAIVAHCLGQLADGVYHMVPAGETTFHGVAVRTLERARANGYPLKVDPARIAPIPTSQSPAAGQASAQLAAGHHQAVAGAAHHAARLDPCTWTARSTELTRKAS
jgi:dTDP-4-dehydrorhamnose reductase